MPFTLNVFKELSNAPIAYVSILASKHAIYVRDVLSAERAIGPPPLRIWVDFVLFAKESCDLFLRSGVRLPRESLVPNCCSFFGFLHAAIGDDSSDRPVFLAEAKDIVTRTAIVKANCEPWDLAESLTIHEQIDSISENCAIVDHCKP
jgi:hypothetical protein